MKRAVRLLFACSLLGCVLAAGNPRTAAHPAPPKPVAPNILVVHDAQTDDAEATPTPDNAEGAEATSDDVEDVEPQQATPTRTPTPINVGNFVWDDLDRDGRQDAGEPGIAGVRVQLWNGAKTSMLDDTTTDAGGFYSLIAPRPGDYRVRVLLPTSGDLFSPKDSVDDDQRDSDVYPSGINIGFTHIYTFASNLISISTIDAGLSIVQPTRTATSTRTATPTATATSISTPTATATATSTRTPTATGTRGPTVQRILVPLIWR